MQSVTNSKKYVKMDPIEHVLLRSDMYVGSNKAQKMNEFVCIKEEDVYKILRKEISVSPAILRIFIEILSNATDNVERSRAAGIPCSYIKVSINKETGETSVTNDGDIIPIEINPVEKVYNHSLIFGQLLTGSNYDDEEERLISGRNGLGATCCNIFSSKFIVKGVDPNNKLTFEQTWTNNMKETTKPIIGKTKLVRGYTSVSYFPDFKQFGLSGYSDDIISIYLKYVIDVAMLSKVKVYFNDELIPVNSLQTYAKLYECDTDENLFLKHGNSEVLVTPSKEFQIISFVNGIYTKLGGQHVDSWSEAIFRPLVDKFNKKGQPNLNIKDIKQFFRIFVVSYVVNPEFDSQSKNRLENPKVPAVVKTSEIAKILKWSVIEEIEDIIKSKEILTLKKSEKKKKGYVKIEGLDPANKAGTKDSHLCSLILCEGLSAKTYAVAGIEKGINGVCGRDFYGVLALRGKCVSPETPILLWNGTIKQAKFVEIGDVLINDEGEQTTVTELFKGNDNMYEIQQNKGDNFTVNSEHTLTLKIPNNCSIIWNENKQRWKFSYFDKDDMKIKSRYVHCVKNDDKDLNLEKKENKCKESGCNEKIYSSRSNLTRHYREYHSSIKIYSPSKRIPHNKSITTKEQGYIQIKKYMEDIDSENNVFDISIKDYLKLNNETKNLLYSFKLNNYIKWERKDVHIDPYILGMWLGDGFQTGYGFASEDVELINEWYKWSIKNNCEIVHNNRDSFTIRKTNCCKRGGDFKKIPIGTKYTSIEKCRACKEKISLACANDEELLFMKCERLIEIMDYENIEIYGDNPLVTLLSKYNLINNKHIPLDYIINDKETRLKLLAGIIDTDGYVGDDGLIEICQSAEHKNILDSLVYMCRSLGFYCNLSDKQGFYTDKLGNKIYKESYRLKISGNDIKEIPTKLQRKKLTHTFVKDSRNTSFDIVEKGVGEYVGFQTDKTHRFLLGDFTVTHNCLNVRNSSMESIAKNKVITDLIQALNLQHGVDYTDENNFKNLSYGKVVMLTDADSVTFDTPCILKNIDTDEIEIKPICEINNENWVDDSFSTKQYSVCEKYLVWSDKGWTKIKSVMRHKVSKPIYRVLTHTGCVDVTEDHSLINKNGEKITVKDCEILKTELLHNKYIQEKIKKYEINKEYAYALGYFQADGHCNIDGKVRLKNKDGSITHSTNSKWIIECVEKEPLENLRLILEKYENTKSDIVPVEITCPKKQCVKCFKIFSDASGLKSHMKNKTPCDERKLYFEIYKKKVSKDSYSLESGREYKYALEAKGIRKDIALKYRNMFYNSLREKKIPTEILNSSIEVQKSFIEGFYAGDGDKGGRTTDRFDGEYKSQIMGLFQVLQNCGYTPSLNCSDSKLNVYNILMCKDYNKPEYTIKKIIDVSEKYKDTYVYDFETENHHFHSSIGNIVVHNSDGLHISSLLMNFFHSLFPSLLKRKTPFVVSMQTPIVRVFRKEGDLLFYDENKFKEFSRNQTSKIKCKYYKGLGTTKSEDVKDTFGEKMVDYINDDDCDKSFNKVFHVKCADQRKEWLEKYDPNKSSFSLDESGKCSSMNITDFLNNEMIKFSHDDCKRSIPNLFDGLKQSQRKVLYSVKKRNLTYNKTSLKVAQLAGYVAEVSNYHHGEGNLFQTITKMANEFPGSNNIPILYRDGQFGSRSHNGNDAANARYIFTKMEPLTPFLFREEDDVLLEKVYDDGDEVEPLFYVPIIPMVLVNGAVGIGSGWSSSVPSYNPLDLIECIEIWLKRDGNIIVTDPTDNSVISYLPDLVPWYRGFNGTVEKIKDKNDTTFITHGIIDKDKNKCVISEIPIGMSTDKFKEMCEDWMVDKKIKNFQNYSTPNQAYFVITESDDGFSCNLKNMKLHSYLYTSNMVLFNEKEQLKKYTIEEIINEFCIMRYHLYKKRKSHMISIMEKELRHLFNKARFVEEVISKKLNIMNVEETVIVANLEKSGYDKENEKKNDDDDESGSGGYNYLLKMQVRTFTSNKVKQLRSEIEDKNNKLHKLKSTSEKQLWLNDLQEFKNEYSKWLKIMEIPSLKLKTKNNKKNKA